MRRYRRHSLLLPMILCILTAALSLPLSVQAGKPDPDQRGKQDLKVNFVSVVVYHQNVPHFMDTYRIGWSVVLAALVINEGTAQATAVVSFYADDLLIGSCPVVLAAHTRGKCEIPWEIPGPVGVHAIRAEVTPLSDETDLQDNSITRSIEVVATIEPSIHVESITEVGTVRERRSWTCTVEVLVNDISNNPVAGVRVQATVRDPEVHSGPSGYTDTNGVAQLVLTGLSAGQCTFEVNMLVSDQYNYDPFSNSQSIIPITISN